MISSKSPAGISKLESAISLLLILGVLSSLLLIGMGVVLFHSDFGHFAISHEERVFIRDQNFFQFFYALMRGGFTPKKSIWLMAMGMAILILTPYTRVIMSLLFFMAKKDLRYSMITLFVFLLLTVILLLH